MFVVSIPGPTPSVNSLWLLTVNAELVSNDNEILLLLSTLIGAVPLNFNVAPPPPPEPLNGTKQVTKLTEDSEAYATMLKLKKQVPKPI